jgi:hypothetical protein
MLLCWRDFMSWKGIEFQVSMSRTQSVGKIQDQLQQRSQVTQDHITMEQNKDDEKNRKQVIDAKKSEKKRLNRDQETHGESKGSKNNNKNKQQKKTEEQLNHAKHPYKGNFVDFSG